MRSGGGVPIKCMSVGGAEGIVKCSVAATFYYAANHQENETHLPEAAKICTLPASACGRNGEYNLMYLIIMYLASAIYNLYIAIK